MKSLSHEKLDVYKVAVEFLALSQQILDSFPKGFSTISDQFRRAALSIPLNVAEGAGRKSAADSARYFSIARGSALECGAILDACNVLKVIQTEAFFRGKELLIREVEMLSKLSR